MAAMIHRHCSEFRQPAAIMKRRPRRILVIAAACALLGCNAAAEEICKLTPIGEVNVAAVHDGRTLLLADGRELRLAGIEAGDDGRALQDLTTGHELRLESLGATEHDRYGRVVAFAFTGDAQQSVQQALPDQGRARVSARVGDKACADGLLSRREGGARSRPRAVGRSQFRPFVGGKPVPPTNRAGSVRAGGRQGIVGARERGHYICELRAALDAGFHRHHSAAPWQSFHHRRGRT